VEVVICQESEDGKDLIDRSPKHHRTARCDSHRNGRPVVAKGHKMVRRKRNSAGEDQGSKSTQSRNMVKCSNRFDILATDDSYQHTFHDEASDAGEETPTTHQKKLSHTVKKRHRCSIIKCSAYSAGLRGGSKKESGN